jgi:hypothetical protein
LRRRSRCAELRNVPSGRPPKTVGRRETEPFLDVPYRRLRHQDQLVGIGYLLDQVDSFRRREQFQRLGYARISRRRNVDQHLAPVGFLTSPKRL